MHFRDSVVWEKAMRLAEESCRHAARLPRGNSDLRGQITRAAVPVPSNIAEGWTRASLKEKAHFLAIAQGSLCELQTQLLLCRRFGWLTPVQTKATDQLADDVSRMLTVLRRKLRPSVDPGPGRNR